MNRLLNDHYKIAMIILISFCKMQCCEPPDPDLKRLEMLDPDPNRKPAYLAKLSALPKLLIENCDLTDNFLNLEAIPKSNLVNSEVISISISNLVKLGRFQETRNTHLWCSSI